MSAPTVDRPEPELLLRPDPRPRRRRLVRLALAAIVVVLLAGAVWMVWFSSVLSARTVRVVGVEGARAEAVLAAADVPVGTPLARIDTTPAQLAVAALPWVAEAEVRRGWPSEIVVAVTPRVPLAVVSTGTTRAAVDAEGIVFEPAGALPKDLPRVAADGAALQEAMAVLASIPADLARRVVAVAATTRDDVTLTLRSGDLVRWGSAEQPEFKAQVLAALMNRKADVYDVAAPELPTTFRSRN